MLHAIVNASPSVSARNEIQLSIDNGSVISQPPMRAGRAGMPPSSVAPAVRYANALPPWSRK